jgi:hypothetical protein
LLGMFIFYSFEEAVLGIMANGMQRKCRIGKREIRAGRNSDKSKDYPFPRILHPFVC